MSRSDTRHIGALEHCVEGILVKMVFLCPEKGY